MRFVLTASITTHASTKVSRTAYCGGAFTEMDDAADELEAVEKCHGENEEHEESVVSFADAIRYLIMVRKVSNGSPTQQGTAW